ncbi:50S ribosomal protein L9 [bacterium]|nr:50S ribosomal protein L9 [bacterium]
MKLVLLDDIEKLGEAGSVVSVKDGYGRNFLIPNGLAEMATKDALNRIELIQRAAEAKRARRHAKAAGIFAELSGKTLVIAMKAGTDSRLFGAVTSPMIADEIARQFGVQIDRRHLVLDEPIKHLGEFTVPLRASADVTGEVKLTVEPEVSAKEIEKQVIEKARAEEEAELAAASEDDASLAVASDDAAPGDTSLEQTGETAETQEKDEGSEEKEQSEEDVPT